MAFDIRKLQNGSDIRGISMEGIPGEEVNLDYNEAGRIGGAFAWWLAQKVQKNNWDLKICVGYDPRLSNDTLKKGIMTGFQMFGAKSYDAGLATTPAMYMSTVMPYYEFDGAVMITASHLPWNRNGFKFFTSEGCLDKEDIAKVLEYANKYVFIGEWFESEDVNLMQMYAANLRMMISTGLAGHGGNLKGMHIVVDSGNGASGFFAKEVLEKLGADISGSQFLEPDGNFPNHEPNPENSNAMKSICKAVVDNKADLGIIFDTDGDRSAAVSPDGKPISRNEIVALAAALGADDYPGGTVVTDSITSNELHDFLEKNLGLKHLRFKRGYKNVINKAKELNEQGEHAFLAIETSGHAAFSDNYFLDDGAFLAVQTIIAATKLKQKGKTINALLEGLESPAESKEFRFKIKDENFAELGIRVLNNMKNWVESTDGLELELPNYEGVRVNYDIDGAKGWFLLRMSLHDPVMPLNIESNVSGGIDKAYKLIEEFIKKFDGIELP